MRIKVDYKTKESKKIMDYSYILKELEKASLFELARLATAIHQELNDPQRIEQIRNSLIVGQNITWFNSRTNTLVEGVITKFNNINCEVKNRVDGVLWNVAYCHINRDNQEIEINMKRKTGLKKSELHIGEIVMFLDKKNNPLYGKVTKLNPKTVGINVSGSEWKVSYSFLNKVKDIDAEIIDVDENLLRYLH